MQDLFNLTDKYDQLPMVKWLDLGDYIIRTSSIVAIRKYTVTDEMIKGFEIGLRSKSAFMEHSTLCFEEEDAAFAVIETWLDTLKERRELLCPGCVKEDLLCSKCDLGG